MFTTSLFAFFCLILVINAENDNSTTNYTAIDEKRVLDAIFRPEYYDKTIRPRGKKGYTVVNVNMYVRSIDEIDDIKREYSCQLTFRQEWKDDRLQYDDENGKIKFITLEDPDKIWVPNLFFSNEKEGHIHRIVTPNIMIRIYPNGDILYSTRISLLLRNRMYFKNYPFDSQMLEVILATYGSTTEDVRLFWKKENHVQITKYIHLPKFKLVGFYTDYCTSRTITGEYSCLKLQMDFAREFNYYLVQIYIPCFMLIIISWFSFWLDARIVTARVTLVVAALITMAVQVYWINKSSPTTSYAKAIDFWTGVCLTFVFYSLLELVLVNYISRKKDEREWNDDIEKTMNSEKYELDDVPESSRLTSSAAVGSNTKEIIQENKKKMQNMFNKFSSLTRCTTWFTRHYPLISERIDVISRIGFPLAFIFFNICYWATYLPR